MKRKTILSVLIMVFCLFLPLTAQDADKQQLRNKLKQKSHFVYDGVSFNDILSDIREKSGIHNIVLDNSARAKIESDEGEGISLQLDQVTFRAALKILLDMKGLKAIYTNGTLTITSAENKTNSIKHPVVIYDIRDLLLQISDFKMPVIDILPKDSNIEKFGSNGGRSFDLPPEPKAMDEPDFIVNMITTNTGGDDYWDQQGFSIEDSGSGTLVVTCSQHMHKDVQRLLALIRQFK